jgi:hypothetical protein
VAKEYSQIFEVMVDTSLFLALSEGANPTLGLFPGVAKGRWKWICDSWMNLMPAFEKLSAGDDSLQKQLQNLKTAVASYNLGNVQNPFDRDDLYLEFMPFLLNIEMGALRMTVEETNLYNLEIERISKLNSKDFRAMRNLLRKRIVSAASLAGKGDNRGSQIFGGQNAGQSSVSSFSDFVDIENLIRIEELVEGVIFHFKQNEDRPPNILALTERNIKEGSSFGVASAYLSYTPVPFSGSLEEMSNRYLGDTTKWFELVTINNLQPPYVDENGTKYMLASPGGLNNVTITSEPSSDVHVGQTVKVGSVTYIEESRVVERKTLNDDGSMTLILSGDQTLNSLVPSDKAYVRIYKPNTVNSSSLILIPSDVRSSIPTPLTPTSDRLRRLDKDLLSFGIDLKRNEFTGDLEIDGNGNIAMAIGMENIRQAVYWAVQTSPNSLPFHPDKGFDLGIGETFFGSETEMSLLAGIISKNILQDPRFSSCEVANITSAGNSISMRLLVTVGDSGTPLPLSFVL